MTKDEKNEVLYEKAKELIRDFEEKNGTIYCIRTKKDFLQAEKAKALAQKLTCGERVKIVLEKMEKLMENPG